MTKAVKPEVKKRAPSGRVHPLVRLCDIGYAWAAQVLGAFVMLLFGQVSIETLSAAIWFPGLTLLIVWANHHKPNERGLATQPAPQMPEKHK